MNDEALEALRGTSMIISVNFRDKTLHISAQNGSRVLPVIVAILERHSIAMTSISIRRPSLEDVFIYLTGKNLEDGNNNETRAGSRGKGP